MADRLLQTLDGESHDITDPFVRADDLGVLRGDGVFETLLIRGGRARTVGLHLARLARSAEALGLPAPDEERWRAAIDRAAERWGDSRDGTLRLVHTRGPEGESTPTSYLVVSPVPESSLAARRDGVSVMTVERGFSVDLADSAPWLLSGVKTLSYATNMAALRHAHAHGYDDVVFLSNEGNVLEGATSTVVLARGNTLVTPPPNVGALAGTTQRALFEVAGTQNFTVEYELLRPADLLAADGVWLLSSVRLATRVLTMNGSRLGRRALIGVVESLVDQAVDEID